MHSAVAVRWLGLCRNLLFLEYSAALQDAQRGHTADTLHGFAEQAADHCVGRAVQFGYKLAYRDAGCIEIAGTAELDFQPVGFTGGNCGVAGTGNAYAEVLQIHFTDVDVARAADVAGELARDNGEIRIAGPADFYLADALDTARVDIAGAGNRDVGIPGGNKRDVAGPADFTGQIAGVTQFHIAGAADGYAAGLEGRLADEIAGAFDFCVEVNALRKAGAKEVHMRVSAPPFLHPCYFGIDIPSADQLIANGRSVEEIRQIIGADSLGYLNLERLSEMVHGLPICTGCFTGKYPLEPPKEDIRGEYIK